VGIKKTREEGATPEVYGPGSRPTQWDELLAFSHPYSPTAAHGHRVGLAREKYRATVQDQIAIHAVLYPDEQGCMVNVMTGDEKAVTRDG
jgi:hypothetical protein